MSPFEACIPLPLAASTVRWCTRRGAGRKTGRADHSDKRRSRTLSASDGVADRPLVSRWRATKSALENSLSMMAIASPRCAGVSRKKPILHVIWYSFSTLNGFFLLCCMLACDDAAQNAPGTASLATLIGGV